MLVIRHLLAIPAATLLLHLAKDGQFKFDMEDEITKETLVSRGGKVVHPRLT